MTPLDNYLLFKQIVGIVFLAELISIFPFFYRYFGLPYNPRSFIHNRATAIPTAIIVAVAALSIALGAMPLLGALVLLCFFRYMHVDCRYDSLSRGAGAVGLVPYYVALYLFLLELSLFVDHSSRLFSFLSTVLRIEVASMIMCAGVTKSLSGYLKGEGVEYALVNPVWSNFPWIFRRFSPASRLFWFLNMNAVVTQILAGVLLLIPQTRWLGGALLIMLYLYVAVTINVALLGVLMMALGLVFLPDLGFTILPVISSADTYKQFGGSATIAVVLYAVAAVYISISVAVKLVLYFQKYLGLRLPKLLQAGVDLVSRHVPVFMWRVFTKDLSNDLVRIVEVTTDGGEAVVFDEHLLAPRPLTGFFRHYRFWHPTEVVALTTIAHQFDHPGGPKRAEDMLSRYVRTLRSELSEANSLVRFEIVNITKHTNGFRFASTCHLTYEQNGELVSVIAPETEAYEPHA